jgi:hypothetical protein
VSRRPLSALRQTIFPRVTPIDRADNGGRTETAHRRYRDTSALMNREEARTQVTNEHRIRMAPRRAAEIDGDRGGAGTDTAFRSEYAGLRITILFRAGERVSRSHHGSVAEPFLL